ncbi:hypothetical protein [Acidocella sp.]|uniref:hypothetical protein n=1 Tax=Acidocella sp. TaxID=50710 RepID=UPI003D02FA62
MSGNSLFDWPDLTLANLTAQGTMLAFEAQQVVALRLTKLAMGGPDVPREAALMVAEKMQALQESGALMLHAALDGKKHMNAPEIVQLYRKKVRANRRRLSQVTAS